MMFLKVLVVGILVSLMMGWSVEGQRGMSSSPPCNFPAIYNFGDSNSDTGAISATFLPIQAPNGVSFFKKPAGRASDGRLIIDFIAEHLNLPYLSAYLDPVGANYRHGVNFATGGSTIRSQYESILKTGLSPFSLDLQTMHYGQFKARTRDLYNQAKEPSKRNRLPKPGDFLKALYIYDIGQNDLFAGFLKLSDEQLRAAIPVMVNQFASAVQNLYQQGARTFWIHNTGPVGCLPVATLYINNPKAGFLDRYGCIKGQNDIAMEFNRQLKNRVIKLRAELRHAALTYVDVYAAKYSLISNTNKEGFVKPLKICCGRHENDINLGCGQKGIVNGTEVTGGACANPSAYISWDGIHNTQAANQWVANHILNGSLSDPPTPISHACY